MSEDLVPLKGMRCARCGNVSVPVQHFGCERCGAHGGEFAVTEFAGGGEVLAAVTVHRHPDPQVATPVVIGSVLLDEGTVVRARLVEGRGVGSAVTVESLEGALVFR